MSDGTNREGKLNLWGWLLFVVCAVLFITSAVRNGDILYLIGSVVFLFACLLFIFPFLKKGIKDKDD